MLGDVLLDLIERKVGGISSARQLAKRLSALKDTSEEGERRSISRHIRLGNAEELTIERYAEAFGVDRSVFPAAVIRAGRGVSVVQFRALEAQVEDLQATVDRLRPLLDGLDPSAASTP